MTVTNVRDDQALTRTSEVRFWSKVDKRGPDECWIWTGAVTTHGYGQFRVSGDKTVRAHRFAYELANGPVPARMFVLHSCDVRECCNPAHLRVGTQADNMRDMNARGRARNGWSSADLLCGSVASAALHEARASKLLGDRKTNQGRAQTA